MERCDCGTEMSRGVVPAEFGEHLGQHETRAGDRWILFTEESDALVDERLLPPHVGLEYAFCAVCAVELLAQSDSSLTLSRRVASEAREILLDELQAPRRGVT